MGFLLLCTCIHSLCVLLSQVAALGVLDSFIATFSSVVKIDVSMAIFSLVV